MKGGIKNMPIVCADCNTLNVVAFDTSAPTIELKIIVNKTAPTRLILVNNNNLAEVLKLEKVSFICFSRK